MRLPSLSSELHDAIVEQFSFELPRGRLTINLLLDVAEGFSVLRKQLLLSGVRNGKEIAELQQRIERAKRQGNRAALNYRLADLRYDNPLASGKADLVIYLAIDHLPALLIQCDKITLQELG
jgi:hypothetical protein